MTVDDPSNDDWWSGRLVPVNGRAAIPKLRYFVEAAKSSHAGAFKAIAEDSRQYWIKLPGNPQSDQVLVNDHVVGLLGTILGCPVPEPILVEVVAEAFNSWSERPKWHGVQATIPHDVTAHASPNVDGVIERPDPVPEFSSRDDNSRRHARLAGLWDLCLGDDRQWGYASRNDQSLWSFDHGFWFASHESDWTTASLRMLVNRPNELELATPIRRTDAEDFAERLRRLSADDLVTVMGSVPPSWGAASGDLEALGWFIYSRRRGVIERLLKRAVL